MQKLYNLLKSYTLKDALELEKQDPQYKALEKLFVNLKDKELFLGLILVNSLVCYQLSNSGETYWEEFSEKASKYFLGLNIRRYIEDTETNLGGQYSKIQGRFPTTRELQLSNTIILFLKDFLPNSRGNKRLLDVKIKRLEKIKLFLNDFIEKINHYLQNIVILRDDLAIAMNQKKVAKTIVFAVKMIMYGIRIIGSGKEKQEGQLINKISIPIDSRLEKIFEKYKEDYTDIKLFYSDLSVKLNIPEIHLDAILWINYKELVN